MHRPEHITSHVRPRFARWSAHHARALRAEHALGVCASLIGHAIGIAAVVVTVSVPASEEAEWVTGALQFLVPPDRRRGGDAARESITWVGVAAGRVGQSGPAGPVVGADAEGAPRGAPSDEAHASPERAESVSADTAYTIMQVDEHVTRHPWSAAPAYPEELRTRRLEGEVFARYVVDSTGRADPESFEVLSASHPAFAESVRRALPAMAFTPARIGTRAVRQLVEQRFAFRLLAEPVQAARSGAAGPPGTPPPGN